MLKGKTTYRGYEIHYMNNGYNIFDGKDTLAVAVTEEAAFDWIDAKKRNG